VPPAEEWPEGARIPREERIKDYQHVDCAHTKSPRPISDFVKQGYTPVAVEVKETAIPLPWFEHPEKPLYVFGPEDGTLDRGVMSACHQFVVVPTNGCMNLAVTTSIVLYDRMMKVALSPVTA
jgi:tRNA(Leu) C34 or U34 (ribose-2'-O)-methylase TrmL